MRSPFTETKTITLEQALIKIRWYCAQSEHCRSEVRTKLYQYKIDGIDSQAIEKIINDLVAEDFINEQRYAMAFVKGKFHIKSWGKNKIVQTLKAKGINDKCIASAVKNISTTECRQKLEILIEKWGKTHHENNPLQGKQKLLRYLIGKGYSLDDILPVLNKIYKH